MIALIEDFHLAAVIVILRSVCIDFVKARGVFHLKLLAVNGIFQRDGREQEEVRVSDRRTYDGFSAIDDGTDIFRPDYIEDQTDQRGDQQDIEHDRKNTAGGAFAKDVLILAGNIDRDPGLGRIVLLYGCRFFFSAVPFSTDHTA